MASVACIIPLIERLSLNNHMCAYQTRGQLRAVACIDEDLVKDRLPESHIISKVIRVTLRRDFKVITLDYIQAKLKSFEWQLRRC